MTKQTIKEWVLANYDNHMINEIADHGCSGGSAAGLIYYCETVKFHDEFEAEIWDMLDQDADDQGITVMELIASFNGQKNVGSMDQLKNLLVWYAIEITCGDICVSGLMNNGTIS